MRIAVCDDCMEDALSLKQYMGEHEVSVYSGADSLLAEIKSKKIWYYLYLLDIFMGESMNGIKLAEKLRSIQENALKKLLLKAQAS